MSAPTPRPTSTWSASPPRRIPDPQSSAPGQYVWEVPFTTGTGAMGTVTVSDADLGDPAKVRAMIAAQAQKLDNIARLTHDNG